MLNKIFTNKVTGSQLKDIEKILSKIKEPFLDEDLHSLAYLKKATIKGKELSLNLQSKYPSKFLQPILEQQLTPLLLQLDYIEEINYKWEIKIESYSTQGEISPIKGIKNIIAIASGKGGVGKSTTCVNLALSLQRQGAKIGILDADIYGPSIPTMLGVFDKPISEDDKTMQPLIAHGVQLMSVGFLIESGTPMIWRGPIVTRTLIQLLEETTWNNLDYLLIDLPPGTGDIQLTLAQKIPVTGVIIVTTPQEISLVDARRAVNMFDKVNIDVLGIIENMSTHICSKCGFEEDIFDIGGGKEMAKVYKVPFLGSMPLDASICKDVDKGTPSVISNPLSKVSNKYQDIAHKVSSQLTLKKRNYKSAFSAIKIVTNDT